MNIRFAKESDKNNIIDIWNYCFDDGPKFTDYYFNDKYKHENTIVVEDDEEIVSSLQLSQYNLKLNDKIYDTSYVVGVSTFPQARGKGYMKHIMDFTLNELYRKNQLVSILMPIDYRLYRKYGYEHCYDQIEYEIGQLVSKSVISEEVVDIFASVGLNKPDISILSDEFLEEVKGLPQKNLALELLRRLLDGKIKSIAKKNVVQAKKFSEMLEASVIQYEKRSLETVEVIKALVDMAKDMNELHKRGEKLGLSDDELAFYDAISSNESARDFYENDVLKQFAKELTISIKNNIKVDWDVRESVRAQMRITVKRLLRKYKYPPDKQATAVDLIIEQAEKMCESELDK